MLFTAGQLSAYLHEENSAVLLGDKVLSLLGSLVRIHILKLLSSDEENLISYPVAEYRITVADLALCVYNSLYHVSYGILEVLLGALFTGDDLFPVPLVNEDRVGVIGIVITADSLHVGVDTLAGLVTVAVESHSLPFSQGLNDLGLAVYFLDVEIDLALNTVEVIVDSAALSYNKRSGHTVKGEYDRQCLLEDVLDVLDCVLSFSQRQ